jgi:hypothetical protein
MRYRAKIFSPFELHLIAAGDAIACARLNRACARPFF